jgi:hypothetical protein
MNWVRGVGTDHWRALFALEGGCRRKWAWLVEPRGGMIDELVARGASGTVKGTGPLTPGEGAWLAALVCFDHFGGAKLRACMAAPTADEARAAAEQAAAGLRGLQRELFSRK